MRPSGVTNERRRTDEQDTEEGSSAKGKIPVEKEEKTHEDSMRDVMVKFNKISERDLPCNRIMWTPRWAQRVISFPSYSRLLGA